MRSTRDNRYSAPFLPNLLGEMAKKNDHVKDSTVFYIGAYKFSFEEGLVELLTQSRLEPEPEFTVSTDRYMYINDTQVRTPESGIRVVRRNPWQGGKK